MDIVTDINATFASLMYNLYSQLTYVSFMGDNILLLYRRILFVGIVIIASLFLLSFILSAVKTNSFQVSAAASTDHPRDMSNSPNVITSGVTITVDKLDQITSSTVYTINNSIVSIGSVAVDGSKFIAHNVGSGLSSAGRATGKGITFVSSIPSDIAGFVTNTDVVNDVIRPTDHVEIPIIDPNSPELRAALTALPSGKDAHNSASQSDSDPAWPIHGRITTEFGARHRPYQRTHTGLDISDGQPAGTTPVKPFRPGKVIEVVRSKQGLGNHIIIDHGNGVTSVYAHLNSFSVSIGQEVTLANTLGFVGTTGVSTGPHLHFEIRVNGQAANPRQFISGHP